tara:strand:+ start:9095 stop:9346 length:252 start_codon:yes stop_codon:yes gene_type:complete
MSANWKYRQSLTKNADEIIKFNQTFTCSEQPDFPKTTHSTNTPYLYTSCVDRAQPPGYETSNMKKVFLEQQMVKCTMIAPEFK